VTRKRSLQSTSTLTSKDASAWDREKQSALIESFLLNIPVPPIYLAEDELGQYSVVDGKQRLTSIHAFMTGNLRLTGLTGFEALNGTTSSRGSRMIFRTRSRFGRTSLMEPAC
jgi:Protein of unknown function DUF262